MIAVAAAQYGLKCHIYCPDPDSPAFEVAGRRTIAAYDDAAALRAFADSVDVVTYEFENIPSAAAEILAARRPLHPSASALATTQDRLTEKASSPASASRWRRSGRWTTRRASPRRSGDRPAGGAEDPALRL